MTPSILLAAGFWMCTALTPSGKLYTASMPTDTEAKTAVLADCKKVEPICFVVKCELTHTVDFDEYSEPE